MFIRVRAACLSSVIVITRKKVHVEVTKKNYKNYHNIYVF